VHHLLRGRKEKEGREEGRRRDERERDCVCVGSKPYGDEDRREKREETRREG
jgi:hypothetical protein